MKTLVLLLTNCKDIYIKLVSILLKNQGAVVALSIAFVVDFLSRVVLSATQNVEPIYIYYVGIFLVVFGWWIATCRLKMVASQIVSGIALVIISAAVLDCYFADGYETIISIAFPCLMTIVNIAAILAAWHDRKWTYATYHDCSRKSADKNNKADICL